MEQTKQAKQKIVLLQLGRLLRSSHEHQVRPARLAKLVRTCGVYASACYLRNRGYNLKQALVLLAPFVPAPKKEIDRQGRLC